jgi:3-hydroxyacyl-CoA dehydrogenase
MKNIEQSDADMEYLDEEENNDARFTVEEIAQYISGWAMGPFDSVRVIGKATLLNALSQLRCDQDGISAVIRRKREQGTNL